MKTIEEKAHQSSIEYGSGCIKNNGSSSAFDKMNGYKDGYRDGYAEAIKDMKELIGSIE